MIHLALSTFYTSKLSSAWIVGFDVGVFEVKGNSK